MEFIIGLVIYLGTSIWVLIDAKKIGEKKVKYKAMHVGGPWGWFWLCLFIWPMFFPSYLLKRNEFKQINSGRTQSASSASISQLEKLEELKDQGILTEEEFIVKKKVILNQSLQENTIKVGDKEITEEKNSALGGIITLALISEDVKSVFVKSIPNTATYILKMTAYSVLFFFFCMGILKGVFDINRYIAMPLSIFAGVFLSKSIIFWKHQNPPESLNKYCFGAATIVSTILVVGIINLNSNDVAPKAFTGSKSGTDNNVISNNLMEGQWICKSGSISVLYNGEVKFNHLGGLGIGNFTYEFFQSGQVKIQYDDGSGGNAGGKWMPGNNTFVDVDGTSHNVYWKSHRLIGITDSQGIQASDGQSYFGSWCQRI